MITNISKAELYKTTPAGYKEEVEHCGKSSPRSAPVRPTQGASINTSTPSFQIPLQFLSSIYTNVTGILTRLCSTLPGLRGRTFESSHHHLLLFVKPVEKIKLKNYYCSNKPECCSELWSCLNFCAIYTLLTLMQLHS